MAKKLPLLTALGAMALFLAAPLGGAAPVGIVPPTPVVHAGIQAAQAQANLILCWSEFSEVYAHHLYQSDRLGGWATLDSHCRGQDMGGRDPPPLEISARITLTYCSADSLCTPIGQGGVTRWYSPHTDSTALAEAVCELVQCIGFGDLGRPFGYSQRDGAVISCETACADAGGVQFTAIVRFTVFKADGWTLYPSEPNCYEGTPDRSDMQTVECLVTAAKFVEPGTQQPPVDVPPAYVPPPCVEPEKGHPICM